MSLFGVEEVERKDVDARAARPAAKLTMKRLVWPAPAPYASTSVAPDAVAGLGAIGETGGCQAANVDGERVFFEEWDLPHISGIKWVEELAEIAGGEPIFPELRDAKLGRERIVTAEEVVRRNPDVLVASWCGKAVRTERIAGRVGWHDVAAVRNGHIYEIKSAYILQPGPASLTEGLRQLHGILSRVRAMR